MVASNNIAASAGGIAGDWSKRAMETYAPAFMVNVGIGTGAAVGAGIGSVVPVVGSVVGAVAGGILAAIALPYAVPGVAAHAGKVVEPVVAAGVTAIADRALAQTALKDQKTLAGRTFVPQRAAIAG